MNELKVKDAMTNLVVKLRADDSIPYAAKRLLANRISGAPVVDVGKLVGVVSEVDIVRAYTPSRRGHHMVAPYPLMFLLQDAPRRDVDGVTVGDVMTQDVVWIGPHESIFEAAARIDRHGVRRLPVVDDDGYLVGILARSDLVRCMARAFEHSALAEADASELGSSDLGVHSLSA